MMPRSPRTRFTAPFLIAGVVAALGCGGSKPAEQAAATTPAPVAALETAPAPAPEPPPAPELATPAPPPAAIPKPKPVPKAAPPPAPTPEPVVKTIGAGTELAVSLEGAVSSKTSQVGDPVRARVTQPVSIDGFEVIPVGSIVIGSITEAVPVKKIGGAASLGVRFDTIELATGQAVPIEASIQEKAKSQTGKDAGTIAGAAAGGALLGRLIAKNDKTKGTVIGAVVGAAAGTGAAAATKGQEVEFAAGTPFTLKLTSPTSATVPR